MTNFHDNDHTNSTSLQLTSSERDLEAELLLPASMSSSRNASPTSNYSSMGSYSSTMGSDTSNVLSFNYSAGADNAKKRKPLPLKQRTSSIDTRRDYSTQTWLSVLTLLKPREFLITVDHFSIWRRHVAWAMEHGKQLKEYMTQRYASSMVFMSLLLSTELNVLLNSSPVTTQVRNALRTEQTHTIQFWVGVMLLFSALLTLLGLISTFTAWTMVSAVSDANAHCMLRSSMGQYVAELPVRFIVGAIYSFLMWLILFFFCLLPFGFWSLLFVVIALGLFVHTVAALSAFGRLLMHAGAMDSQRIFEETYEASLLPHGLHQQLLQRAQNNLANHTSIRRQYSRSQTRPPFPLTHSDSDLSGRLSERSLDGSVASHHEEHPATEPPAMVQGGVSQPPPPPPPPPLPPTQQQQQPPPQPPLPRPSRHHHHHHRNSSLSSFSNWTDTAWNEQEDSSLWKEEGSDANLLGAPSPMPPVRKRTESLVKFADGYDTSGERFDWNTNSGEAPSKGRNSTTPTITILKTSSSYQSSSANGPEGGAGGRPPPPSLSRPHGPTASAAYGSTSVVGGPKAGSGGKGWPGSISTGQASWNVPRSGNDLLEHTAMLEKWLTPSPRSAQAAAPSTGPESSSSSSGVVSGASPPPTAASSPSSTPTGTLGAATPASLQESASFPSLKNSGGAITRSPSETPTPRTSNVANLADHDDDQQQQQQQQHELIEERRYSQDSRDFVSFLSSEDDEQFEREYGDLFDSESPSRSHWSEPSEDGDDDLSEDDDDADESHQVHHRTRSGGSSDTDQQQQQQHRYDDEAPPPSWPPLSMNVPSGTEFSDEEIQKEEPHRLVIPRPSRLSQLNNERKEDRTAP